MPPTKKPRAKSARSSAPGGKRTGKPRPSVGRYAGPPSTRARSERSDDAKPRARAAKLDEARPRAAPKKEAPAPARPLSASQKRHLRGFAHEIKPVILVGQKGVTEALLAEFAGALEHHELVKVKLADDDRESRAESIERIRDHAGAELVQAIGKTATFYKRNPDRNQYPLPK